MKLLRPGAVVLYILFLMLPIYWLVIMSFKTTNEILGGFSPWPQVWTTGQLPHHLHRPDLVHGLRQLDQLRDPQHGISVTAALPAAYAFSRYRFLGDKHLFFWLFTNRMAPAAVFALPFLQLYYAVGLFDTYIGVALAHCLFNIPLAVWILEGFMSGVPEGARRDRLRRRLLLPALLHHDLPAQHQGRHRRRRLLLLHVLLGRDAALQDPDLGRTPSPSPP